MQVPFFIAYFISPAFCKQKLLRVIDAENYKGNPSLRLVVLISVVPKLVYFKNCIGLTDDLIYFLIASLCIYDICHYRFSFNVVHILYFEQSKTQTITITDKFFNLKSQYV